MHCWACHVSIMSEARRESWQASPTITQACNPSKFPLQKELAALGKANIACCGKPVNPAYIHACNYDMRRERQVVLCRTRLLQRELEGDLD